MGVTLNSKQTISIVRELQSSYLFDIFFIFVPCRDRAQNVENNDADHRQINGFVLREISIGENIVPVHGGRQDEKSAGKGG